MCPTTNLLFDPQLVDSGVFKKKEKQKTKTKKKNKKRQENKYVIPIEMPGVYCFSDNRKPGVVLWLRALG